MRILYICRVFSGLETSLSKLSWQPTGAPTIYKIMEALDRSENKVRFLIPCKGIGSNYRTQWDTPVDQTVIMSGLKHPVFVLASEHRFPKWLGRIRGPLTSLRQLWRIFQTALSFRPELVYVDRANVLAGALLAHLLKTPVVLRVMGVYPSMWDVTSEKTLRSWIIRWAFRAPFAMVICTQDGSGGEYWLPKVLRRGVPFHMLLNGRTEVAPSSDSHPKLKDLPKDRTIVLFVGRFETIKGCEEFVEAIITLHSQKRDDIHGLMIGTGYHYHTIRSRVREAGAEDMFTFIERLPHANIAAAHKCSDIYVSLNRLGQLSNSNLEAMSLGACMVIPAAQYDRGIDVETDKLIDGDSVVRIPWHNQVTALADIICELTKNPERRNTLSSNVKATAQSTIPTWHQRVEQELKLIGQRIGRPL